MLDRVRGCSALAVKELQAGGSRGGHVPRGNAPRPDQLTGPRAVCGSHHINQGLTRTSTHRQIRSSASPKRGGMTRPSVCMAMSFSSRVHMRVPSPSMPEHADSPVDHQAQVEIARWTHAWMCAAAMTHEQLESTWDDESPASSIGARDALSL